jgi:hypothetical protein
MQELGLQLPSEELESLLCENLFKKNDLEIQAFGDYSWKKRQSYVILLCPGWDVNLPFVSVSMLYMLPI